MHKKIIAITGFLVLLFLLPSAHIRRSSSGAPASHTGAPGEATCSESGCHDDHALNQGKAEIQFFLNDGQKVIDENQTYALKIRITDKNITRFGFQVVALEQETLNNAGTFTITDSTRTQTVQNMKDLKDRNYVTYTFNGTDAVSEGAGEWTVNWTAPPSIRKNITFYVAAVSANDDMSDKGDHVYTGNFTVAKAAQKK